MKKFLLSIIVLFFGIWVDTKAQEQHVTGKVVSAADGSDLPGVNVRIKGTTKGTISDIDGRYDLTLDSPGDTILFTFIGYQPQEVIPGQRTTLDIRLEPETTE